MAINTFKIAAKTVSPIRVTQPQGSAILNKGNALASKITHCLQLNGQCKDIVTNASLIYNADGSNDIDVRGRSLRSIGNTGAASINMDLSPYNKITISFWLKWDTFLNDENLALEFTPNSTSNNGFIVNPNNGSYFTVGCSNTDGKQNTISFFRPSAGYWHHYYCVLDRTAVASIGTSVFVDGVQQMPQASNTETLTGAFANSTLYLFSRNNSSRSGAGNMQNLIVRGGYAGGAAEAISEYINPWQIYSVAHAAKYIFPDLGTTSVIPVVSRQQPLGNPVIDVKNPLSKGLVTAITHNVMTGNGNVTIPPITQTGTRVARKPGVGTSYNGTQSTVFPHNPLAAVTGASTVFTVFSATSFSNYSQLAAKESGGTTCVYALRLGFTGTDSKVYSYRGHATNYRDWYLSGTNVFSLNTFYVLAQTYADGTVTTAPIFYYGALGNQVSTVTGSANGGAGTGPVTDGGSNIRIGTRSDGATHFDGVILCTYVFDRALSRQEIQQLANDPWIVYRSSGIRLNTSVDNIIYPITATLGIIAYAPVIYNNITINVPLATLAIAGYAPSLIDTINVPLATLTATGYVPTITATANRVISVPVAGIYAHPYVPIALSPRIAVAPLATMVITDYVPTVVVSDNIYIDIPEAAITITTYDATVLSPRDVMPPLGAMAIAGYAPAIMKTNGNYIAIPTGTLAIAGYAPAVNKTINIPTASLIITKYAPTFVATANIAVNVPLATLTIAGYVPVVASPRTVVVPLATLTATGYDPTVTLSDNISIDIPMATIDITSYDATVLSPRDVIVPLATLTVTGYVPVVVSPRTVLVPKATLTVTGYVPVVVSPRTVVVPKATLTASTYVPVVVSPRTVLVPLAALTATTYVPVIVSPRTVVIPKAAITIHAYAPTYTYAPSITIAVPVGNLTITANIPAVNINTIIRIPLAALTITARVPIVAPYDINLLPHRSLGTITAIPRLDISRDLIIRGNTNAPVNLTGCTISAKMTISKLIAGTPLTVSIVDAPTGLINIFIAADDIAAMNRGTYLYSIIMITPTGKRLKLVEGNIVI